MKIEFSHGFRAKVFRVSHEQRKLFPDAELVREDLAGERKWFARSYYGHKIAHLLFPNNFIEVYGSQVDPPDQWLIDQAKLKDTILYKIYVPRIHMLYSKKAALLDDHSSYSAHMGKTLMGNGKESTCKCNSCIKHRDFHREAKLDDQAKKFAQQAAKIGILLPDHDPSDYCLTKDGVIFFEIDFIAVSELRDYILSLKRPSFDQKYTLRLLNRYKKLMEEAKIDEDKKYADIHVS